MADNIKWLWLQRFTDGGDGGSSGGEAAGAQTDTGASAEASPSTETAPERLSFEALIKGEYKDDYQKAVDKVINKRFAQAKGAEEELERYKGYDPVLAVLGERYQVDTNNPEELVRAIQNDEAHIQAYADDKGISTDEAKRQIQFQAQMKELEALKNREAQREREYFEERQRQEFNMRIQQGIEETKGMYGDSFDFDTEAENAEFTDLLRSGIPVKTAFEVVHKDELLSGAIQKAVADTQKRVAQDIAAKGKRPLENGIAPAKSGAGNFDVNNLTKATRQDIEARAMRGEKITPDMLRAMAQK